MGAEIWAIAAVGVALAGLILSVNCDLRRGIAGIRGDIGDVRLRIARLEGMFRGFAKQRTAAP